MEFSCKGYLLFLILIAFLNPLYGQQESLKFERLSIEHGLSQGTINCILKDKQGFMWFGTNDGLNKYDGYNFKIYRNNTSDSTSICDNKIYALLEDNEGNLWIGTRNGLSRYNREKDNFLSYKSENKSFHIGHNFVRTIFQDTNKRILVGTLGGGLFLYDKAKNSFSSIDPKNSSVDFQNNITTILESKNGVLWMAGSNNDLYQLSDDLLRFQAISIKGLNRQGIGKTLYEDQHGYLWICTEGAGLFRYDVKNNNFINYTSKENSLNHNIVKDIFEVKANVFWIATDGGGLNVLEKETETFYQYHYDIIDPHSIGSNAVFKFYQDNEGIIWIGTYSGGVNIFNKNKKQFIHYTKEGGKTNTLSHRSVLCLLEDDNGEVLIGTGEGGLNVFNPKERKFSHFKHNPLDASSISSNVITALYKDSKKNIWIGTYGGGLNLFDKEKNRFIRYGNQVNNSDGLTNNNVWTILEQFNGNLLIGTLGGLFNYDEKDKKFISFLPENPQLSRLSGRIITLFEDSKKNLWIGGSGLVMIEYSTNKSFFFKNNPQENGTISTGDVRTIFEDSKGRIWIGTEGGGLNLYHPEDKSFSILTVKDLLPSDAVHKILEDNHHNLWLSTNMGISKFNPENKEFRNYDIHDGLQSNEFSYGAGIKGQNGYLYFGGVNGFNVFHPDSIKDNPFVPPVVFTDFKIFNKSINIHEEGAVIDKHISQLKEIVLPYNQSFFTFEFTALNFTSPEKNQYEYMLEGFNNSWSNVNNQRTATFTNLNPGDYIFRVRASNNDGKWNEDGASIKITILPPFWKTKWAFTLYVVIFFLLLLSYRKYALDRAKLKHDIQLKEFEKKKIEEVNQMKMRFFTNISHEFRTPLTLIIGPLEEMLSKGIKDNEQQRHYLMMHKNAKRLLHLINQLMDLRKIEQGKLNLFIEQNDFIAFVKDIMFAFNDTANHHQIDFELKIQVDELMAWFDRDKMDKVIYNLLSNAFKFTPDEGKITITIKTKTNKPDNVYSHVEIEIRDTGCGIESDKLEQIFQRFYQVHPTKKQHEQEGTGIGLSLVQELVELHKGQIEVESEPGKFSVFRVLVPIAKEYYSERDFIKEESTSELISEEISVSPLTLEFQENPLPEVEDKSDKPLVLVVDDNRDIREFIRSFLKNDYQIFEAFNGLEGLKIARKIIPDLIIMDIMMPEMNGLELLKKLKKDENTDHVPVLLITAFDTIENNVEGLEIGADDYITKPFSSKILKLKIKNIFEARERYRQKLKIQLLMQPKEVLINSEDDNFIHKAVNVIESHMSDSSFDVTVFVKELGISRSVLYRKMKVLTNQSANEFINMIRLKRAAQLLKEKKFTISQVSYEVGFNDPQYFSKCFKKQYGMSPTEYAILEEKV